MSDDEAAQAMKQLHKNNEGTGNFEEFKMFWSSKSELEGYSSMALKFLKINLQMEGFAGMGKRMFTRKRKQLTRQTTHPRRFAVKRLQKCNPTTVTGCCSLCR